MLGFTCPLLSDPLGYPTDLQLSYPGLPVYFNRTDVKKAMHAPMDVDWLECAPKPVFKGDGGPQGLGVSGVWVREGFQGRKARRSDTTCYDLGYLIGPDPESATARD